MLKIAFDKRIELVLGILYCAYKDGYIDESYGKFFFLTSDSKYYKKFYELYKKNISVDLLNYIKNNGFDTYNRTIEIALSLQQDYSIKTDNYIQNIQRNNPNFNKEKLEQLLKEFVIKSNYEKFYNEWQEHYNFLNKKFTKALNFYTKFNYRMLDDFYGLIKKDKKILLFNFVSGSFGYSNNDSIISLISINDNKDPSNKVINTVIHEFSHPYVNPYSFKYFENIDINHTLNEAISNGLPSCYHNKYYFINEYVVRAIQVYFQEKIMEQERVIENIKYHQNLGYIYIEQLKDLMYEKNKYSDFESFYKSEIVLFFSNIST